MTEANDTQSVPNGTYGKPSNTFQAPPPQQQPQESEAKGFDFLRHETVQGCREVGIWTYLGARFGELEVRLRPFYETAVVVKREAAEAEARLQLGLTEDEPLPGDQVIKVNQSAINMAITGCRGRIRGNGTMQSIARKFGWKVDDGGWITLEGTEPSEQIRELFIEMVEKSMTLLTTLVRASRELDKVKDAEIASVGKDFCFGRHVRGGWED